MITLFFYYQDPFLIDFEDPGVSISGERYCETLKRLRRAIKAKRQGKLGHGVTRLADNGCTPYCKCRSAEVTITKAGDTRLPALYS